MNSWYISENDGLASTFARHGPTRATQSWGLWPTTAASVHKDPKYMNAEDWHSVLVSLPIWRGWTVDGGNGSLYQANDQVFEPNPIKILPSWEIVQGSGKKRHWRIESEFDNTVHIYCQQDTYFSDSSCICMSEDEDLGGNSGDVLDDDSDVWRKGTIHLFFVNTNGIITEQISTVTSIPGKFEVPSITPWMPGTIQELGLRIPPASIIAASCSTGHTRDVVVVVVEQVSTLVSSHLFEVIRKADEAWKVLPRPKHQLEAARGGPLLVLHPGHETTFKILYHSITTGSLNSSEGDPGLKSPFTTEEVMPPSHLPFNVRLNRYGNSTRVCFAVNPWVSEDIFVAMRDEDDTVNVAFWRIEKDVGRSIKTLSQVCKTRPQTDFCLAFIQETQLLIVYIALDGQMEMAILNTSDDLVPPDKLPRWPIFLDCCDRILTRVDDVG